MKSIIYKAFYSSQDRKIPILLPVFSKFYDFSPNLRAFRLTFSGGKRRFFVRDKENAKHFQRTKNCAGVKPHKGACADCGFMEAEPEGRSVYRPVNGRFALPIPPLNITFQKLHNIIKIILYAIFQPQKNTDVFLRVYIFYSPYSLL